MKYSLQCKYSMINQAFLFVIKSLEQDYSFQWQVKNVDQPVWLLTNNNIVFKAEITDDLVSFSVEKSDQDIHGQLVKTATTPILKFETDNNQLQFIYDFDEQPTDNRIIVANILSQVIQACGGGFLQTNQQYKALQKNIEQFLIQKNLLKSTEIVPKNNKQIEKEQVIKQTKSKKTKNGQVKKNVKQPRTKKEQTVKQISPKRGRARKVQSKAEEK